MTRRFRLNRPRPSTRAFTREARRIPGFSWFDWLHGYVYLRWPYLYVGIGTGEHPLARVVGPIVRAVGKLSPRWSADGRSPEGARPPTGSRSEPVTFADTYHGKVVPLEAAKQLVMVEEEIRLRDLEQVIPYARARDIVLKNPDHIVALECPCRASRQNPCLPLDVCLIVGEPFASFVAEHHVHRSRWITQQEAVEVLRAEHERGHVHHAFFKDAMLGRFYAICNCCACCCGAMQAWQSDVPMLASSGYVCRVDTSRCKGCGTCSEACQFRAVAVVDGKAVVDVEACMGCGVCVSRCERQALALVRDASKGQPLEIRDLLANREEQASPAVVHLDRN